MRIGNLAELTGTPVETIRFYEREGLLPAAQRTENNYRLYTPQRMQIGWPSSATAATWTWRKTSSVRCCTCATRRLKTAERSTPCSTNTLGTSVNASASCARLRRT